MRAITSLTIALACILAACGEPVQELNDAPVVSLPIEGLTTRASSLDEDQTYDDYIQEVIVPGTLLDSNNDGFGDWYFDAYDPDYQLYFGQFEASAPPSPPPDTTQCSNACANTYNAANALCSSIPDLKRKAICYAASTVAYAGCLWYCG